MTSIIIFGTWMGVIGLLAYAGRKARVMWSVAAALIPTTILAVSLGLVPSFSAFLQQSGFLLPEGLQTFPLPDGSPVMIFAMVFVAAFILFAIPGLLAVFIVRSVHLRRTNSRNFHTED